MKVLTKVIISIVFIFSIVAPTFAEQKWYIEQLLDLNYWIETFNINLASIDKYNFNNSRTRYIYTTFKSTSEDLKNEILKQYRKWNLDYYRTKWIITNYKNFIYYSNKYFYFQKQKEYYNSKTIDNAILKNVISLKSYYMRIKFLVNKK